MADEPSLTTVVCRPLRTEPITERFRIDFGATSPAFADALECLSHAWAVVGDSAEPRLAFETWQRYLTVTYGQLADQKSDDLLRLFLKHTYLASLARLLIWASLSSPASFSRSNGSRTLSKMTSSSGYDGRRPRMFLRRCGSARSRSLGPTT